MFKQLLLAGAFALSFGTQAADPEYYIVVPFPGKTASLSGIAVMLNAATLPAGTVDQAYAGFNLANALSVTGDSAFSSSGVSWSLTSGALPIGLTLGTTGALAGTPTVATEPTGANFTVTASYKTKTGQQVYTIVVGGVTLQVTSIVAGAVHTCALTTSGAAKCWGDNWAGQLGDGANTQRSTPVQVVGLTSGVASISAGNDHTCVVTTGGAAKCWGYNLRGQLGDGTTTNRSTPVQVSGLTSGVASISGGSTHTCALTTGGSVSCWGSNGDGRLGDGTTTQRNTPVQVSGLTSGVASISGGLLHTCAVTTGGAAKCWGNNGNGQLGDGTTTQRNAPTQVSGLASGVASIAAGGYHTCAVTTGDAAKCWGYNGQGGLGDGTATQRLAPVQVSGLTSGVASIALGERHTCVVTTGGAAKCWGGNSYGQRGDGTTTDSLTPVQVSGLTSGVASISGGLLHTCAVTTGGAAKCWGWNFYNQVGDGTKTNRSTPVDVLP